MPMEIDDDQIMPANPQPSLNHHGNIEADVCDLSDSSGKKERMKKAEITDRTP